MTARVPNRPLREAFVASRTPVVDVCWWLEITRYWPTKENGVLVADVCKLSRMLGLSDAWRDGERFRVSTVRAEFAQRLCALIDADFHELYPEVAQESAGMCSTPGCGEPLYELRDGFCGWCSSEREAVAA